MNIYLDGEDVIAALQKAGIQVPPESALYTRWYEAAEELTKVVNRQIARWFAEQAKDVNFRINNKL